MSLTHTSGNREEVLNVVLANLLNSRKIDAAPESIKKMNLSRKMPDITVTDYYGLKFIIEGRYFETSTDEKSLIVDSKKRISDGLGPVCIAVLYPPYLRTVPYSQLPDELSKSKLRINYFTSTAEGNWSVSDVSGLTGILRKSFDR